MPDDQVVASLVNVRPFNGTVSERRNVVRFQRRRGRDGGFCRPIMMSACIEINFRSSGTPTLVDTETTAS